MIDTNDEVDHAGLGAIATQVVGCGSQGYASPRVSYHPQPACGGNFSFVVDYGGKDQYGCGVQDNSYNQRGSAGGFVIDRPKEEELETTAKEAETAKVP